MTACALCNDTIYEWEVQELFPDVHLWCAFIRMGMRECVAGMAKRKEQGLPTPSSPFFRDPNRPAN